MSVALHPSQGVDLVRGAAEDDMAHAEDEVKERSLLATLRELERYPGMRLRYVLGEHPAAARTVFTPREWGAIVRTDLGREDLDPETRRWLEAPQFSTVFDDLGFAILRVQDLMGLRPMLRELEGEGLPVGRPVG